MAGAGAHEARHGEPDGHTTGQEQRRVAPRQPGTALQQALGAFVAYLLGELAHALCSLVQVMRQPQAVITLQRSGGRACTFLD